MSLFSCSSTSFAALLVAGIPERIAASDAVADVDLGHHAPEIFGIVGQVVELGSVKIERAARRIELGGATGTRKGPAAVIARIQNYVKRLAAAQVDRVGVELGVVSRLVA